MAFNGEDREMRMSGTLGYHPLENPDQRRHQYLPPQHHHHRHLLGQQEKATAARAQRFSDHGGATAAALNSGGSNQPKSARVATAYRECLKNHAASVGGNVTDGCGEFMPSGEDGTIEALKCAACNCHRNFHRKETRSTHSDALPPPSPSPAILHRPRTHMHGGGQLKPSMPQPVKMAFGGGGGSGGTDSSSGEELNFSPYQSAAVAPPPETPYGSSRKRFRTKFTAEQKDKMLEFAEKVGWRIPREEDSELQRFCVDVGVKRQVFKVWMHNNNKNPAKKNAQES